MLTSCIPHGYFRFRGQKQEKYCRTKMDEKLRQNSVTTTEKFLPSEETEIHTVAGFHTGFFERGGNLWLT